MPPPIAVDLRQCTDGSAVRTALVAWPRHCTRSWPRCCMPRPGRTNRQTDGSWHCLMPPYGGGHNKLQYSDGVAKAHGDCGQLNYDSTNFLVLKWWC